MCRLVFLILISSVCNSQPPSLSGGLSANSTFYTVEGIEQRRDPWFWMLNGNITLSYKFLTLPFSATFNQQQRSFTQPFNQFGVSPNYKGFTSHLGYRSMHFSDFTFAGAVFLGVGFEYAPSSGKWKTSSFYGRLARPVNVGGVDGLVKGVPAFERWACGSKWGINGKKTNLEAIFFRAWDKPNSINPDSAFQRGILPQENLVLGAVAQQKLTARWTLQGDYAWSAYTENMLLPKDGKETSTLLTHNALYKQNLSTRLNSAFQGALNYQAEAYQFSLRYRYVAPEYKTMGAAFMANDLEDFSGNLAWKMLKNRINTSLSGGLQRNNLNNQQLTRVTRLVFNAQTHISMSKRWMVMLQGGNFNTSTQLSRFVEKSATQQLNADSLFFLQVTENLGASLSYQIPNEKVQRTFSVNGNWQAAKDNRNPGTEVVSAAFAHQSSWKKSGWSWNLAMNLSRNQTGVNFNESLGPMTALSKTFSKSKLRANWSCSVLETKQNGNLLNHSVANRLGLGCALPKQQNISLDATYLMNQAKTPKGRSFSEFRVGVNYAWNFSNKKKDEKKG